MKRQTGFEGWLRAALALLASGFARAEIPPTEREGADGRTAIFVYAGQFSDTRLNQIVRFDTDFRSSWVAIVGMNRRLADLGPHARLEAEANVAQHRGLQSHPELNAGVLMRWNLFPWDAALDTSFALGSGLSYAFKRPRIEWTPEQDPERWLKYMVVELEVTRPEWGDWSGLARIHHRSGIFGLLSDARGSNFVGLGLRRRF